MDPTRDLGAVTRDLSELIVKVGNLRHLKPEQIELDQPLYREGLGLDSIDLLELVVHVERKFGLKIRNDDEGRVALKSLRTLADVTHRHLRGATGA